MSKSALLGPWVKRFLLDHLITERNLSRNTQRSYRDSLALLLPYASAQNKKPIDQLEVFHLSNDVLRRFLDYLEQSRRCSIRTRNQRLAAVHAMARFIAERSPEHIAWCGEIRSLPFKRFTRNELSYLDKPEMDALLAAPDGRTKQGMRDHALLLFLYNSGARVTEAASLQIGDLNLRGSLIGDVQLKGKGNKTRRCPLWPATGTALLALVRNRSPDEPVFLNRLARRLPAMVSTRCSATTSAPLQLRIRPCLADESVRTPSGIRQPHTYCAPVLTSTLSAHGWVMSPSIQPTSMQKSTSSGKRKCSHTQMLSVQIPPTTSIGETIHL
jgi:integrase/recombinase XerD